jgi:thiol-disulfide isomerase/thioredoxin
MRPLILAFTIFWCGPAVAQDLVANLKESRTDSGVAEMSSTPAAAPSRAVWFYTAAWCGACRQMHPVLDRLERSGITVHRIDIDKYPHRYRGTIPLTVTYVGDQKTGEIVGVASESRLRRLLEVHQSSGNPAARTATWGNRTYGMNYQPCGDRRCGMCYGATGILAQLGRRHR